MSAQLFRSVHLSNHTAPRSLGKKVFHTLPSRARLSFFDLSSLSAATLSDHALYGNNDILPDKSKHFANKSIQECTELFTYQPPFCFWQHESPFALFPYVPEYLIRERMKEKLEKHVRDKYILKQAQGYLNLTGLLRQSANGYVYLKIDDAFTRFLFPLIKEKNIEFPDFTILNETLGAHCGVILANEVSGNELLKDIREIGQKFSFKVKGCFALSPQSWAGVEKVWFLTLTSPELEHLREKYLLPSKICGHDFTVVLAVKKTQCSSLVKNKKPVNEEGYLRVHVGYHPV